MTGATFLLLAAFSALSAGDGPVRNPFWPIGYNGRKHPITTIPRYPSKTSDYGDEETESAETAVTNRAKVAQTVVRSEVPSRAQDELWQRAHATLRFNNICSFVENGRPRITLQINGNVYEDGELVSINHNGRRFTWLVLDGGTNGNVRLRRMHVSDIRKNLVDKILTPFKK